MSKYTVEWERKYNTFGEGLLGFVGYVKKDGYIFCVLDGGNSLKTGVTPSNCSITPEEYKDLLANKPSDELIRKMEGKNG